MYTILVTEYTFPSWQSIKLNVILHKHFEGDISVFVDILIFAHIKSILKKVEW